jgi:hypothetical protein
MKTLIKQIGVAVVALVMGIGIIDAKPSSSSGFKSSSSSFKSSGSGFGSSSKSYTPSTPKSSSSGFGSSSKSYGTTGSSSNNSAKYSGGSTSNSSGSSWFSKPQTSTRPQSNVERSKYEAASKSGTVFKTRESAIADFKAKEADTYTSKFTAEPAKRPDYIPQTYKANGTNYNITYNQSVGGYGYWSGGSPGIGSFLLYDALSDAVMMNTLMDRDHYYVGDAPPVVYDSDDSDFGSTFLTVIMWIVVLIVFCIIIGTVLTKTL